MDGVEDLFVPGLLDLDALATLTERSLLLVNAKAGPGGSGVKELAAVGVRRIWGALDYDALDSLVVGRG
ncbi:isocitrate lyase/phosphoenolpyruvate mutase family protein [Streptomyces sp. JJ38]|uniref:isocitrate lyase/phosphoenolpyruvate mutase family protein n=1 Tax=Streptomyces sp. JJ38 TaxID=2738128 RepID=UPI001C59CA81|nr:isocitrate lyase/phosphoenolpyruvate mutase family protein [Streptomyces sp. JJ38]MBW1595632.1 hypothetical protein [Streptomyces sp. JJ38]